MPVQERYPCFLKDQRRYFDELVTEDWESYKSAEWDYAREFEVKRLFRKIKPASILDIGCGCGFHDRLMGDYPFVRKIDAIDYSPKSIEIAESVYPHPKITRTATAFETFKTEYRYDLVVSFQVFEHLYNPKEFLRFCIEHCARSGYVAISTPNRLRLINIMLILGKKDLLIEDPQHYREYTLKEIVNMGREFELELFDSFSYGILDFKKLSVQKRMILGYYLPLIADRLVAIFKIFT